MTGRALRPFTWGAATSAFQIEGARNEDGKADSIWDRFYDDGRMPVGGDPACDHYHRWEQDLDLLAELGVTAYRFSIAWPRVIPDGDGAVNQPGLDFYRTIISGMLDRGVEPWPTLYHWDLPQAIQDRGGWSNRETVTSFSRYTAVLIEGLGDLVDNWITINEPWVAAFLGHLEGKFAPGIEDWPTALRAAHHMLLSHGRSAAMIKQADSKNRVGISLDCRPATPASDREEDTIATRHFDGYRNRWFFDAVFGMGYPVDMLGSYARLGRTESLNPEFVVAGDLEEIAVPIEFVGVNYYTTTVISAGMEETDEPLRTPGPDQPAETTEMGWLIDPDGLRDYLVYINERYQPRSIVVTENGASYSTGPDDKGVVDDVRRINYLDSHIRAVFEAIDLGAPVDGYFVWSLLDNLEWVSGYSQRFGLVWVDFETLERIPKKSFYWYRDKITSS